MALQSWAQRNGFRSETPGFAAYAWLAENPFDYLFSIFNVHVLPPSVLALARKGSINYHDALLPRYAGLHAPCWAILNQERAHGVTWHLMSDVVDAGDILKQRSFALLPEDTALDLNGRCFDAAISAFEELVRELCTNAEVRRVQDLSQRTYFAADQRPDGAGVINWRQSGEQITALVRALDLGPFKNPFGLPKIAIRTESFVSASKVTRLISDQNARPGTILRLGEDELVVATISGALAFTGLKTRSGESVRSDDWESQFQLRVGEILSEPDPEVRARLGTFNGAVCRHEKFWSGRLERVHETFSPTMKSTGSPSRLPWKVPEEVQTWLKSSRENWTLAEAVVAMLGVHRARMQREGSIDVGWLVDDERMDCVRPYFAPCVPFCLCVDLGQHFEEVLAATRKELIEITRRITFAADLILRTPNLRQNRALRGGYRPFIAVQNADAAINADDMPASIVLTVPEAGVEGFVQFFAEEIPLREMERMVRQFSTLFRALITEGERPVGRVSLVADEELAELMSLGAGPKKDFDLKASVHDLFAAQATRTPHAIAVEFRKQKVTYGELNKRANRLASRLTVEGINPGMIVGVFLTRSVEMIVALLAILKAGAAYLPLDVNHPRERIAAMLHDAKPGLLITTRSLEGSLPQTTITILRKEDHESQEAAEQADHPEARTHPGDLAYIIYTSGTAGQPKGVMIEHHSLTNYTLAAAEKFGISMEDRILQFASLSFDACAEEIYPCLTNGATLVLRTEEMLDSPARFLQGCADQFITVLDLPTAYWHHLVDSMDRKKLTLPASIRLIIIGGEEAAIETWKKWVALKTRATLINTYGPTEATIVSTWINLTEAERKTPLPEVPIGRSVPNTSAYVLDAELQFVPLGEMGELVLGGVGLARGYLNLPDASGSKFIDNPISGGEPSRLYRTGDKARYGSDGNLEFHGRLDHQVKIRGFRVELTEIETTLAKYPGVQNNIVVSRMLDGALSIWGFIVPRNNERVELGSLRGYLRESLPEYMIPSRIIFLPELPLLSNGKIDRRVLENWSERATEIKRQLLLPESEMEKAVLKIWQEIMPGIEIGVQDNFFDLGGHSLTAVAINARVNQLIGADMPLQWIFADPTVSGMARHAESAQSGKVKLSSPHRSDDEMSLSKLCEEVLQSGPLSAYQNFTSFLTSTDYSTKITDAIRRDYGVEISGRALYEKATVAQLMEAIRAARSKTGLGRWKSLFRRHASEQIVALRREGKGTPVFICPGGWTRENELVIFAGMLPYFPADRPVYGLKQDFALRSSRVESRVQGVAQNFLREMIKVCPSGPCDLVAECISLAVGLELAHQLLLSGRRTGRLILLDPTRLNSLRVDNDVLYRDLPRKVRKYYHVLAKGPLAPFRGKVDIISPDDEAKERSRVGEWRLFADEKMSVLRAQGNHQTYLREHRAEVGRQIGQLLENPHHK